MFLPRWRSVLFIPASAPALLEKAQSRGADALQLDLEDAVPADGKEAARQGLREAVARLAPGPGDILVRINRPWRDAVRDLEAAVLPGIRAVTLPKVSGPGDLAVVGEMLDEMEAQNGVAAGSIGIVAQIETAAGLLAMASSSAFHPRLVAVTLGPEDFTLDLGVEPSRETLTEPLRTCVLIARAAGARPLGFARSIGDFDDLEALGTAIREAYTMGLRGAFCIHPRQVSILNEAFRPSASAVLEASAIVRCFEDARERGSGVASRNGKMIDRPVYERARAVLAEDDGSGQAAQDSGKVIA